MHDGSALVLGLGFSDRQLGGPRRRRPVNLSRIIAGLIQAKIVQIIAMPSSVDALFWPSGEQTLQETLIDRLDLRADNDRVFERVKSLFLEESERKLCPDTDTLQLQQATPHGNERIRHQPAGAWKELANLQTSIKLTTIADIEQLQGKAWKLCFPVLRRQRNSGRLIHNEMIGKMTMEFQPTQAVFRHNSRKQNEAQHHREQKIEEIVASIDGCDADRQGKQQELNAL